MRYIKTLLLVLLFTMVMPLGQVTAGDTTMVYTQNQVDSIVAKEVEKAVKAEVARLVDTELIDLKIDKAANEKLGTYISEQNNSLSKHDYLVGGILTILVGIVGIGAPFVMNREWENRAKREWQERLYEVKEDLNNMMHEVTGMMRAAQESEQIAKKSARHAEFSVKLSRALNNKDIGVQIIVLTDIIKDYQDEAYVVDAYTCRAIKYIEIDDREKAINDYTKAIELVPNFYTAYNARGTSYQKTGLHDKAIKDFTKAIELKKDYYLAYINRGKSFNEKGEYDKAISDFTEAIALDAGYYKAYYYLGISYCKKDEFEKSLSFFNKAIRLKPNYARAYFERCDVLLKLDKEKEAYEDAIQGLEISKKQKRPDLVEQFEKKIKEIEEKINKQKNDNEQ